MRRLIWILIFLILSVFIGLLAAQYNDGYVLIIAPPWSIQSPLWFALLASLFVFLFGIFLVSGIRSIQFTWYKFRMWLRFRKGIHSYSNTQHGFLFLIEGRWKKAESLLMQGALDSPLPVINHLCAAEAAHEAKQFKARDQHLKLARREAPEAHLAIAIAEAEMKLSEGAVDSAVMHLVHHLKIHPKHPRLLKLLLEALERQHNFTDLLLYLPVAKHAGIIEKIDAEKMEITAHLHVFQSVKNNLESMKSAWKNASSAIRSHPAILFIYCSTLARHPEHHRDVEKHLRAFLNHRYDAALVELYAQLNVLAVQRRLVILGAWLKEHGHHAGLLMALAHVCTEAKLWGRAKEYYQASLDAWRKEADPESFYLYVKALREYGQLLESLSEHDKARMLYGLELDKILEKNYTSASAR